MKDDSGAIVCHQGIGPLCVECLELRSKWPLFETIQLFLQAIKESRTFASTVEAARAKLRDLKKVEASTGRTSCLAFKGLARRMVSRFLVYTADQFLTEFQKSHTTMGFAAIKAENEGGVEEEVILLRDDRAPRVLEVFSETSTVLKSDLDRIQVREGQA